VIGAAGLCYSGRMTPRKITLIVLLLLGAEAIGLVAGDMFYRLCLQLVPPAFLTGFNRGAARVAFTTYGAILGVVVFAWSLTILGLGRIGKIGKSGSAPMS